MAELSANHHHDLRVALDTITAAAEAGADAVKLQTYRPESLTLDCDHPDFTLHGGLWDGRRLYDLYREAMTPWEWHEELFSHARKLGLTCFSTPFDFAAVDLLASLGNPIYKIASFEVNHLELIRYAARQGKPMVLSAGVASARELAEAVAACREEGCRDITLLKCTSAYPARVEDAQLPIMAEMRSRFGVKVGLSDHSPGSLLPVMSVAIGATMIEKHLILDRSLGGPDAAFSMNVKEFAAMVRDVRAAEGAMQTRGGLNESEGMDVPGRQWCRSLYASADIREGDLFTRENIACVRPGYGAHPRDLPALIGTPARRSYRRGEPI